MDQQPKKKWGDRPDGQLVRGVDSVHAIIPFLLPKRCDAEVFLRQQIDVTELKKHLDELNAQQDFRTTVFHAVVTAAAKTVYMRPLLNRFIENRHYFDRNRVTISFMAKRQFTDHAEEVQMILDAKPDDTLTTISRRIVGDVSEARHGEGQGADRTLDILAKFPRPIMAVLMAGFRFLDRHGWLPASFCAIDPNHTTVMLSNLGSIKSDAAYHHLNNFGNNSIFATIGYIQPQQVLMPDGTTQTREIMELCFTLDERIADGFYFARSVQLLKEYLQQPELLDRPIKEEI